MCSILLTMACNKINTTWNFRCLPFRRTQVNSRFKCGSLHSVLYIIFCFSIVLSVIQFTASNYPFSIFKLFIVFFSFFLCPLRCLYFLTLIIFAVSIIDSINFRSLDTHECKNSYKHIMMHSVTQIHDGNMFTKNRVYIM